MRTYGVVEVSLSYFEQKKPKYRFLEVFIAKLSAITLGCKNVVQKIKKIRIRVERMLIMELTI